MQADEARGAEKAGTQAWRTVGVVTFVGAGLLLLSFGGGIVAAPLTLPVMFLASRRHPTRAFRLAAAVIGGLTALEVAWAATYLSLRERRGWIWVLPTCCGLIAAAIYAARAPHRRTASRDTANAA